MPIKGEASSSCFSPPDIPEYAMQTPRQKIVFRRLDGILLLDKPQGLSSNAALQLARRLFRAEKGGHTGSLDPLATGLLPLCFGEATKIAGLLLGSAKAYEAGIRLGVVTDTDDADGRPAEIHAQRQFRPPRPLPGFNDRRPLDDATRRSIHQPERHLRHRFALDLRRHTRDGDTELSAGREVNVVATDAVPRQQLQLGQAL